MKLSVIPWLCMVAFVVGCVSEQTVAIVPVAEPQPAEPLPPPPPPYMPQVNTVTPAKPVAKVNHVDYKQVILDGLMAQSVVVEDVRRSRTNDGYERVQVLVKNVTQVPIRTKYRFDWQDAKGVVVVDPDHNAWEKETLIPGDNGTFTSIAPKKDCADFRLRMKNVQ